MKYICLFWAFMGLAFAEAQQYQYRQYTTEEGLAHNQVFSIYEDTLGFMWFGTDNGLMRFDGQAFYDMRNLSSDFSGSFTLLQKANDGGFWAGIYKKGLYKITPGVQEAYHGALWEAVLDSDFIEGEEYSYSSLAKGIYILREDSVKLIPFKEWYKQLFPKLGSETFHNIVINNRLFRSPQGQIMFFNNLGLFQLNHTQVSIAIPSLGEKGLSCYGFKDQDSYWLGGAGQLFLIREQAIDSTFTHPDWENRKLHFLKTDSQNNLWISVQGAGVYRRNPNGEIDFMGDEIGLKNEFANFIYEDKSHALWFATTNSGVFRVEKPLAAKVEVYPGENNVKAIGFSNEQEIWAAASNQIYLLSQQGRGIPLLSPSLQGEVQGFNKKNGHTYASIYIDNSDGRRDTAVKISPGLFALTASNTTFIDEENLLVWYAHGGLAAKINQKNLGQLTTWHINQNGSISPINSYSYPDNIPWRTFSTHSSYANPDGSIWVAQNKGIYFWDSIPEFNRKPILPFECWDIAHLADGRMLFATSKGLYLNQGARDTALEVFFEGISANCMINENEQRLWVGTKSGLYLFELSEDQIKVKAKFAKSLIINCLLFDDSTQTLWYGTNEGLYKMNTELAAANVPNVPPITITELITRDSTYLFPQDVTIPSDNNYLNFRFSSIEYRDPAALQIYYRLNGRDWQVIRSQEIQLAALADGNYQIEFKASNDGLRWSEPKNVNFRISPPIWKNPWFYAFISVLSVVLIGFLAWRRIINVKKREKEKRYLQQKLTELEQQALGAMMNPHFIFNTLNSIQHFFNQNDPAEANEYLARFAQLIRLNMEVVQQPRTTLDEELDRLNIYLGLEQLRFGDKMAYQLEVEPQIDTEEIMIPSMLMQPFVENAIWHGIVPSKGKGWVHIQLKMLDEDTLRIRIDDNGPGVFSSQSDQKSAHTSRGVEITRSRLHHYSPKARLSFSERKDADGKVLGTQVELRIPV